MNVLSGVGPDEDDEVDEGASGWGLPLSAGEEDGEDEEGPPPVREGDEGPWWRWWWWWWCEG